MSYAIIALFRTSTAKVVSRRSNVLAATSICKSLNSVTHVGDFEGAFFRFVDATKPYCGRCGKQDLDNAKGCLQPSVFSPAVGDWVCNVSTQTGDNAE